MSSDQFSSSDKTRQSSSTFENARDRADDLLELHMDRLKRRENRPPALDLDLVPDPSAEVDDSPQQIDFDIPEDYHLRPQDNTSHHERSHSRPQALLANPTPPRNPSTRATSSASSSGLDAYYFTNPSPNPSPPPPPPRDNTIGATTASHHPARIHVPKTPDYDPQYSSSNSRYDPQTPARDPSAIDRRGLIGVGELATPRWATSYQSTAGRRGWEGKGVPVQEESDPQEAPVPAFDPEHLASPWTMEAVDDRLLSETDTPATLSPYIPTLQSAMIASRQAPAISRTIRHKASLDSGSGGEEILYKPPLPKKDRLPLLPKSESASISTFTSHDSVPVSSSTNKSSRDAVIINPAFITTNYVSSSPPSTASLQTSASSPSYGMTTYPDTRHNHNVYHASTNNATYPNNNNNAPLASAPPSATYNHHRSGSHRSRKRTSEEFAMDQYASGLHALTKQMSGASLESAGGDREGLQMTREEKVARKHKSLGVGMPSSTRDRDRDRDRERERSTRDRRRGESMVASSSSNAVSGNPEPRSTRVSSGGVLPSSTARSHGEERHHHSHRDRHARHLSASSVTANFGGGGHESSSGSGTGQAPAPAPASRRVHTHTHTDFSHLPPSPSTSSITNFLKNNAASGTAAAPPTPPLPVIPTHHSSPSVGHALLRGNQEGWNAGLDDPSAQEALRRLDGVAKPSTKNRSSMRSAGSSAGSRPGTPGTKTMSGHWEGYTGKSDRDKIRGSGSKEKLLMGAASNSSLRLDVEGGGGGGGATVDLSGDGDAAGGVVGNGGMVGSPISADYDPPVPVQAVSTTTTTSTQVPMSSSRRKSMNGVVTQQQGQAPGSARSSYGAGVNPGVPSAAAMQLKRGSASSTAGTPTSTSRDSTTLSTTTSTTSVSAAAGSNNRHSYGTGKARRNSAGSDVSSVHSGGIAVMGADEEDREGEHGGHGGGIPPVPPLPKDFLLGNYGRSHAAVQQQHRRDAAEHHQYYQQQPGASPGPHSNPSAPATPMMGTGMNVATEEHDRMAVPSIDVLPTSPPRNAAPPTTQPPQQKSMSKKWSFSGLSLKLPTGSSSGGRGSGQGNESPGDSAPIWSPNQHFGSPQRHQQQNDSYFGVASPSLPHQAGGSPIMVTPSTSVASTRMGSLSPERGSMASVRTPEGRPVHSRTETGSSASTSNHQVAGPQYPPIPPPPSKTPLSPKRSSTTKRLTPSSIPFFRRSSSQSMHIDSSADISIGHTTRPVTIAHHASTSSVSTAASGGSNSVMNPSTPPPPMPPPPSKKSSVLSYLKGGSSRKSVSGSNSGHWSGTEKSGNEKSSGFSSSGGELKAPVTPAKEKKDDKDRSESRISVLMGRKRGKTLSSTDSKKSKEPVPMPPMQITAIPSSTAQRVANLKPHSGSATSTPSKSMSSRQSGASPASHLSKASDASLRSSRQHLPTIAGSPSVGPVGVTKELSSSSGGASINSTSAREKETPTKIPRISSRTSTTSSPQGTFKGPSVMGSSRRTSLNMSSSMSNATEVPQAPPSPQASFANEFGVFESNEPQKASTARTKGTNSPSTVSTRLRQSGLTASSTMSSVKKMVGTRESTISFNGMRKSSTASVISLSSTSDANSSSSQQGGGGSGSGGASSTAPQPSRFSALSPSKSIKMLSPKPKVSAPQSARVVTAATATGPSGGSTTPPGRQSLSTPSPVPTIDEEEWLGDEEMMAYIKRTHARKIANGAKKEDLDEMLKFPEPLPPVPPSSPTAMLKSNQAAYLSDYERKEILDFPAIYYIGGRSEKKPATRDNPTNNHGYDDERGDYLVVNHDHLAYRYEVIDTLGKGSFGQVLHCRDHCTGQSVAIKIIRNKKRFYHQALVEIKILDNLKKWDHDEKHHVIKMTEHFYFRSHLCIAMELLSINLYELIKANGFVGFSTNLIRRFTSQMLASLALMRHHRIVHCDLKPENVLLRHPAKSAIKVIDFGSSCFEHEKVYTYIQSRFYRSPEVILGMNYHMAIDMWSLGCILAELYTGFPIFPGENEQEQLSCIMEVLGIPDKELINRASRKKLFFDSTGAPRPVVNSKGRRRRPGTKTLAQVLRCEDENFVDFIGKCLIWDPERRLKPAPAMRHPFVLAGRRAPKPPPAAPQSTSSRNPLSSSSISSRHSKPTETPKKSQIGAPTPLSARVSTRIPPSAAVPSTPTATPSLNHASSSASHRSYRTSQAASVSYHHHSPRTLAAAANNYLSQATATKTS